MTSMVDWQLAVKTADRLVPGGPEASRSQAREVVSMLRDLAEQAVEPVERVTHLSAGADHRAQVVDRRAWIRSNASGMQVAMQPLLDRMQAADPPALVQGLGSRGTAVQIGVALAWLSGKVLGQYEAFAAPGQSGHLLLVAPTIVTVERQLGVPERDFRLWVCLHEETHRVQFGANPWLSDYMRSLVADFVDASELSALDVLRRLMSVVASGVRSQSSGGLLEALQSPEQRAVFDRMTGLMSLLEGHADVVMDEVGPQVVPSVALIRERFNQRRSSPSALDSVARRALGMDIKLRQYTDGAAFVREVIKSVGVDGFNRVWTGPEALPTRPEIAAPARWVERMQP